MTLYIGKSMLLSFCRERKNVNKKMTVTSKNTHKRRRGGGREKADSKAESDKERERT